MKKLLRALQIASLYFSLVFGAGFLLGPLRVLFLEPQIGPRWAELTEMPIMALVIYFSSRFVAGHFWSGHSPRILLFAGALTAVFILAADIVVGMTLRKMTLLQTFTTRDAVSSSVYYGLLVFCTIARP